MKVSELIKLLKDMPQELEVLVDYGIDDLPVPEPRVITRAGNRTYVLLKIA